MKLVRPEYPRSPPDVWSPLLRTEEVAREFGVSPSTVQGYVQAWRTTGGRMGLERPTGCGRFFSRFEVLRFWQTRIAEKYVAEIYRSITHYASNRMVHLRCIRFNFACPKAEDFRAASDRFYAHSFHDEWAGAYGVCIHRDICLLRPTVAAGIVLHEVGHIMAQDRSAEGAEPTADQWVRDRLGIEILYSPETLEYLSRGDMRKLGLAACKKLGWKAIPAVVHTNAWGPAGAGAGDGRAATPDKR